MMGFFARPALVALSLLAGLASAAEARQWQYSEYRTGDAATAFVNVGRLTVASLRCVSPRFDGAA